MFDYSKIVASVLNFRILISKIFCFALLGITITSLRWPWHKQTEDWILTFFQTRKKNMGIFAQALGETTSSPGVFTQPWKE